MNKVEKFFIFALSFCWAGVVQAASTQFVSPNFQVQSVIVGGTGILHVSGGVPPTISAGPTVNEITENTARVDWSTNRSTNAIVELGTISGVYGAQSGQFTSFASATHSVSLSNLKKGTTYFYRVLSQDVLGNVVQSVEKSFATSPGDITPPKVVGEVNIANNSSTSVSISWQTDKLSNGVVKFGIHATSENTLGNSDDLTLFHQVQINGLLPSQAYLWQLQSKDAPGNIYLAPVQTFTTLTAPSITGVKFSNITLDSAIVEWTTTLPTTSIVSYGVNPKLDQTDHDLSSYANNHLLRLSNLASGTVYSLKISGNDQSNNLINSDVYTFQTVIVPTIIEPVISAVSATSAKLTWKSSSDIDQLVHLEISKSYDPTLVGKKTTVGDEKLVSNHEAVLSDLASKSEYSLSIVGKDQYGNQATSQIITFTTLEDLEPAVFENIKTDTTVDLGSRQTVQVLVSIDLSKPATVVLEYGAGVGSAYEHKVTTDTELTRSKLLVIPGLQPGQSYHFHAVASTAQGVKNISEDSLVQAPTQSLSLTDLIFGQLQSQLGWLGKL